MAKKTFTRTRHCRPRPWMSSLVRLGDVVGLPCGGVAAAATAQILAPRQEDEETYREDEDLDVLRYNQAGRRGSSAGRWSEGRSGLVTLGQPRAALRGPQETFAPSWSTSGDNLLTMSESVATCSDFGHMLAKSGQNSVNMQAPTKLGQLLPNFGGVSGYIKASRAVGTTQPFLDARRLLTPCYLGGMGGRLQWCLTWLTKIHQTWAKSCGNAVGDSA